MQALAEIDRNLKNSSQASVFEGDSSAREVQKFLDSWCPSRTSLKYGVSPRTVNIFHVLPWLDFCNIIN